MFQSFTLSSSLLALVFVFASTLIAQHSPRLDLIADHNTTLRMDSVRAEKFGDRVVFAYLDRQRGYVVEGIDTDGRNRAELFRLRVPKTRGQLDFSLADGGTSESVAFFIGSAANGSLSLHATDGSTGGTYDLTTTPDAYSLTHLTSTQTHALFLVGAPGSLSTLFGSDGTPDNTKPLLSGELYGPIKLVVSNKKSAIVSGKDGKYWIVNGTASDTTEISIPPTLTGRIRFVSMDTQHFLYTSDQLSAIDDTGSVGANLLDGKSTLIDHAQSIGSSMIFRGYDVATGIEPWVSDGTAEGTNLLVDSVPGPASMMIGMNVRANEGHGLIDIFQGETRELWYSDGTPDNTLKVDLPTGLTLPFQLIPQRSSGRSAPPSTKLLCYVYPSRLYAYDVSSNSIELLSTDLALSQESTMNRVMLVDAGEQVFGVALNAETPGGSIILNNGTSGSDLTLDAPGQLFEGYSALGHWPFAGDTHCLLGLRSPAGDIELWMTDGEGTGTHKLAEVDAATDSTFTTEVHSCAGFVVSHSLGATDEMPSLRITDEHGSTTVSHVFDGAGRITATSTHLYASGDFAPAEGQPAFHGVRSLNPVTGEVRNVALGVGWQMRVSGHYLHALRYERDESGMTIGVYLLSTDGTQASTQVRHIQEQHIQQQVQWPLTNGFVACGELAYLPFIDRSQDRITMRSYRLGETGSRVALERDGVRGGPFTFTKPVPASAPVPFLLQETASSGVEYSLWYLKPGSNSPVLIEEGQKVPSKSLIRVVSGAYHYSNPAHQLWYIADDPAASAMIHETTSSNLKKGVLFVPSPDSSDIAFMLRGEYKVDTERFHWNLQLVDGPNGEVRDLGEINELRGHTILDERYDRNPTGTSGVFYFFSRSYGAGETALWRSDGSIEGTIKLTVVTGQDLAIDVLNSSFRTRLVANDRLYVSLGDQGVGEELHVLSGNRPPQAQQPGVISIQAEETLTFPLAISDPDGDSYTVELDQAARALGVSYDENSESISLPTQWTQGGLELQFAVKITDANTSPASTNVNFFVAVEDIGVPPSIEPITDFAIDEGQELRVSAIASDDDGDVLSFSLDNLNLFQGMSIDASSGEFTWTPGESHGGLSFDVSVIVEDSTGLRVSQSFQVSVAESNSEPTLPTLTKQLVRARESLQLLIQGEDPDLPANVLTFSLDQNSLNKGMSINTATGELSWTPMPGQAGVHFALVSVADDGTPALTTSTSLEIEVIEASSPPVVPSRGSGGCALLNPRGTSFFGLLVTLGFLLVLRRRSKPLSQT